VGLSLVGGRVGSGTHIRLRILFASKLAERTSLQLHTFTPSNLLWVFLSSMVAIYKIGRFPLRLRVFTDDRTLGLKPFANTSLHLITIYVIVILLTFPIFLYPNFAVELSLTIFLVPGIFFFLVPLFGLHKEMREVRNEKSALVGLRHSRVMSEVEAGGAALGEGLVNGLLAIDAIKR